MHSLYHWNPYALPWAVVGLALLILAGVIYRRQRASRVAVLFCALIAQVGIWFGAFTFLFLANDPVVASRWVKVALTAVALLPATIYDFTATALRLRDARVVIIRICWLLGIAFALLTIFTDWVGAEMVLHPWGYYPTDGPLLPAFLLFFLAVVVAHQVDMIAEYRRTTDPKRRLRILRMAAGFVVVYAGAIDFLPIFGVPMRPVSWVAVVGFMAVAWGTIRRHRLPPITAARAAREILETMADALFVLDEGGKIRVVNDAVTTLFGHSESEVLGRSIDSLEWVSGDATISRTLGELSRHGPIRDQERIFRHKDGGRIDVSVSISPVSEDDLQSGAVVIARDIRARKRADVELRSFTRRLEQSNRELEDFAYVASHDLQEPLRKIQAFGDRLESKYRAELAPQALDYIARMRAAAGRMQVLINDLLTFSRVATKAQPFVPVDLGQVAREVVRDLEVRVNETGGSIVLGALPVIDADPLQIRQLFQNLAANALKFHREGVPPVVQIGAETGDGVCRITVEDNGIGFDDKYGERIFTVFERLHGRGGYEGTGIGLAICRRIAERHKGTIVARGRPGEGSTFVVTLPLRQSGSVDG